MTSSNAPQKSPKATILRGPHPQPLPAGAMSLGTSVNPAKLLGELRAQLGVSGNIVNRGGGPFLVLKFRPPAVTDQQVQAVVAAHHPAPVANPAVVQLLNWQSLTAADKDALLQTALKKVYGVP
jgi:hypothetical protein